MGCGHGLCTLHWGLLQGTLVSKEVGAYLSPDVVHGLALGTALDRLYLDW